MCSWKRKKKNDLSSVTQNRTNKGSPDPRLFGEKKIAKKISSFLSIRRKKYIMPSLYIVLKTNCLPLIRPRFHGIIIVGNSENLFYMLFFYFPMIDFIFSFHKICAKNYKQRQKKINFYFYDE